MRSDSVRPCLPQWGLSGSWGRELGRRKCYLGAEDREEQVQAGHSAHADAQRRTHAGLVRLEWRGTGWDEMTDA